MTASVFNINMTNMNTLVMRDMITNYYWYTSGCIVIPKIQK